MDDTPQKVRDSTINALANTPVMVVGRGIYELGKRTMKPVQDWYASQTREKPKPQPKATPVRQTRKAAVRKRRR